MANWISSSRVVVLVLLLMGIAFLYASFGMHKLFSNDYVCTRINPKMGHASVGEDDVVASPTPRTFSESNAVEKSSESNAVEKSFASNSYAVEKSFESNSNVVEKSSANLAVQHTGVTGTLFKGEKIRTFDGKPIFRGPPTKAKPSVLLDPDIHCENWNVVTTIFEVSEAIARAARLDGWCTVVVGDTKSPDEVYVDQLLDLVPALKPSESKNRFIRQSKSNSNSNRQLRAENNKDFVVYLSVEEQKKWMETEKGAATSTSGGTTAVGSFLEAIPYGNFARKNIGFLYAVAHGAKRMFDFDDDNILAVSVDQDGVETVIPPIHNRNVLKNTAMAVTGPVGFNHHEIFKITVDGTSWPRGFPMTQITNPACRGRIYLEGGDFRDMSLDREVGVLQFVADNNPDVDSIHRLVQGQVHPVSGKMITFKRHVKYQNNASDKEVQEYYNTVSELSTHGSLLAPSHAYVPYNAQATVHMQRAMFALYLPFTVSGRVSDIWRSYFSQALFRDIDTTIEGESSGSDAGLRLVFLPPDIFQERNDHALLADMQSEEQLFLRTEVLLDFLSRWKYEDEAENEDGNPDGNAWSIPARMEKLFIDLYERNYIDIVDVETVQLWLAALHESGYDFPKVQPKSRRRIRDVVLMGQFNYPSLIAVDEGMQQEQTKADLLFWHQKWRQRFQNVVLRGPFPTDVVNDLSNNHDLDINFTKPDLSGDKGYVSPIDNLLASLIEFEHHSDINGVLYVHDDLLLNVTNVFDGIDRKNTILHQSPELWIRIHPSGTGENTALVYTTPDGYRTEDKTEFLAHLRNWHFNALCVDQLSEVAKDPRIKAYLKRDDVIEDGNPFLSVWVGQSDFAYVPTSVAKKFEEVAQVFLDHDGFLECSLPSILDIISTASEDIVDKSIDLCTDWNYDTIRGTTKMISGCKDSAKNLQANEPLPSSYGAIHPFKLGAHVYKEWDRVFDWATT